MICLENKDKEIFYTVEDMRKIFQCGRNQIYKIINLKGFPKIKIGKKTYIPQKQFEKWVDENCDTVINLQ